MSMAIIANPLAGRGRGKQTAERVKQLLTERSIDFEMMYTKYHRHGIELAHEASSKHELVVALGGDGTIGEVLEGIWETSSTLGIIPGGTGNDYARGLGIPRNLEEALQVLLDKNTVSLDVGVEKDKVFGVLASIGFPAHVIQHVNNNRNGIFKGSLAILAGLVSTLRSLQSYPIKISIDGMVMEKNVVGVFLMNMPYGGGGLKFAPQARFNDGHFSIVIVEEVGKLDLALTLPKVYFGKHTSHPDVTILTGQEVEIESEPLVRMFDGDMCGTTPLKAKIIPHAAQVVVPKPLDQP